jgi:undecaprenyl-diphosphatase
MPLLQAIILGIVQGLTEFLPVSSTAHLAVIPWLLGWRDPGLAFDIALHVGTLAAVLLYFFRDWVQVVVQGFGGRAGQDSGLKTNRTLLWLMVVATIPAGIAGLLFQHKAETTLRSPYIIAGTAIGVGLIMWYADYAGRKQKDIGGISWGDAISVGLAQALAVVPGVSRSGITITAGLFRGLDRQTAARFSFLLSAPVIAAAAAKDFWDLIRHEGGIPADMRSAFLAGIVVSAITGSLVIRFFMNYLRGRSLFPFVVYRIIFGIIVIALATFFRFNGG